MYKVQCFGSLSGRQFASFGVASVLLVLKTCSNVGFWSCSVDVVGDCRLLTVVFGFFFTAFTMLLSSPIAFLGWSVLCMLVSGRQWFLFFRTFQIVLPIVYVCAMRLTDFQSFFRFIVACFSSRESSLVFILICHFSSQVKPQGYSYNQNYSVPIIRMGIE